MSERDDPILDRDPNASTSLFELTREELAQRVTALGGRAFHARVVRENVLAKGLLDYERMTSLPLELRRRLASELPILAGREVDRVSARDGTTKLLIEFARTAERSRAQAADATADDAALLESERAPAESAPAERGRAASAAVEVVHMPSLYTSGESDRVPGATLCVSTQVGCPVACPFCASGKLGLVRNLKAHEIVEQYVRGRALGPVARSVVMGIGEPLLNYAALASALDVVHDEMKLGARKITVSTVGFPDRLRKIAPTRPRFQLAISLHSPDQDLRDTLVPAMRGVPIEEVLAAADDWFERTGREVTYEYVLLGDVNDSSAHAGRLAERLASRRCTVNLIPFNPVADSPYRRPPQARIDAFQSVLAGRGIVATVRWSRGVEEDAACGQLRARRMESGRA